MAGFFLNKEWIQAHHTLYAVAIVFLKYFFKEIISKVYNWHHKQKADMAKED
jgi:hypothetical protein